MTFESMEKVRRGGEMGEVRTFWTLHMRMGFSFSEISQTLSINSDMRMIDLATISGFLDKN
jgi:hypothetical protein